MGDMRYAPFYERIKDADNPLEEIRHIADGDVVAALAAASRERDPYLSNVLATEAQNRMHWASSALAHLAEGVVAIDAQGRVTSINPAAEAMLGWTAGDVRGKDFHELVQERRHDGATLADESYSILQESLTEAETTHGEAATFTHRSGHAIFVDYTASPILRDAEIVGAVVVFRDITARREEERRRAAQLAALEVLSESRTVEELARRIVRVIGEHLGWDAGGFWILDEVLNRMHHVAAWHRGANPAVERFEALSQQLSFPRGIGLPGRVWERAHLMTIPDVAHDDGFARSEAAAEAELRGAIGFPITLDRDVIGVVEMFSHEMREDFGGVTDLLATMGYQIGQFVNRKRLEEGRHRLAEIVDCSEDAIVGNDLDGLVTSWNTGAEHMFGFPAHEAIGRPIWLFVPPSLQTEEQEIHRRVLEGEHVRNFETTRLHKDGRHIDISLTAFPVRGADEGIVGAAAISRDITEQKRTEQALRASEERFRLLAENARDVIYQQSVVAPCRFEYVSPSIENVTGYSPAAFYDDPDLLIRVTHAPDRWLVLRRPELRAKEPIVVRTRRKDGRLIWTESRHTPIYNAAGRLVALQGILRDITEIKAAEERFRMLLESAPDALIIVDSAGHIRIVNQRTEKVFGYDRGELIGKSIEILVPQQYRGIHKDHRDAYMHNPRTRPMGAGLELTGVRKDGTEFPVEISLAPMQTEEGRWVTAAIRDVQERQAAGEAGRHLRALETGS